MIEKFDGIVLRTLRYSDNLMIADIFTRQHGRLSFLVPVSCSRRSKVRSTLFQPLAMLSFTAPLKRAVSLSRINDVQPYVVYSTITSDVIKSSIAMFISELLSHSLREGGEDEQLFAFLSQSIAFFDTLEDGYANFHLVFMVQLLHFLGIYPNLDNAGPRSYFDLMQGCAVNEYPMHSNFIGQEMTQSFVSLLETDYMTMHELVLNRKLRGEYLAILVSYYRLHVPDFPVLKSMDVLKVLFD